MDAGGAQEHVLGLARGLDRERWEVTVAVGTSDGDPGPLLHPLEDACRVVRLRHLTRELSPRHDPLAVAELGRAVDRVRPDVVHTHSSKAGVVGRLAAASRRVPVVHNVHGWSFRDVQPLPVRAAARLLERRLARVTDAILVVSEADLDSARRHRIRSRTCTAVVRSGVDLDRFRPDPRRGSRPHGRPVIGAVGRLSPLKDPLTAVRAVAGVVRHHPDVVLRWVGDGPLRSEVLAEVHRLGLDDHVELLGRRDDVPDLLCDFDLLLLSSTSEGLPRSVVEAMAAGVPVVATAVGGVPEVVVDGVTGLTVPPRDPAALADAVRRTLDDPAAAARRARRGLDRVAAFSIGATCDATADAYDLVLR